MLKVFLGFAVSLVVLLSSAYVPWVGSRAYATSANVLMTQIQAGGVGAATQEFIVTYNNSPDDVDITGWCLTNKNAVTIACFDPPKPGQTVSLPAHHHAVAVSATFVVPDKTATVIYTPSNQSSGSITGSSDMISLVDADNVIIDQHMWTTPIDAGQQFERHGSGDPLIYDDTDTVVDWSMNLAGASPIPVDETEIEPTDAEDDPTDVVDSVDPADPADSVDPVSPVSSLLPVAITEILPNAVGSDDGNEFIELFNPNDTTVDLANYTLYVGPQYEKSYYFPDGSVIEAGSYLAFSNTQIPFSLLNSSSLVRLSLRDGTVSSDVPVYTNPKDGESWANFDGDWRYTNQPTPGLINLESDDRDQAKNIVVSQPVLKPCAANQYRSLETNRCRLISSTTTTSHTVTPCRDDQYRSAETNRCRNIVVAAQPAPCKEGQERNPETNRCRTVTKMPTADYGVLGAETTKGGGNWYAIATVGGVLLLALAYAVWEWHDELGKFFRKFYAQIIQFARRHK